jgi:hypothetical protein
MRTDYYTTYSKLEEAVLHNIGYGSVATSPPATLRTLIQHYINAAIYYIYGNQEIRHLTHIHTSYTLASTSIWEIDLIDDVGINYLHDLEAIYIYDPTVTEYKGMLKYVTPATFVAKLLPNIHVSTSTPKNYTFFDGRYMKFYPKNDELYVFHFLYKQMPPLFSGYTGNSPFTNEYDPIVTSVATSLYYLGVEEIEIGSTWLQVANGIMQRRIINVTMPLPFGSGSLKPESKPSKAWKDPMAEGDE